MTTPTLDFQKAVNNFNFNWVSDFDTLTDMLGFSRFERSCQVKGDIREAVQFGHEVSDEEEFDVIKIGNAARYVRFTFNSCGQLISRDVVTAAMPFEAIW